LYPWNPDNTDFCNYIGKELSTNAPLRKLSMTTLQIFEELPQYKYLKKLWEVNLHQG